MNYCLGFIFNKSLDKVLLVKKTKGPGEMAGRLNGIGGKLENDEAGNDAMERECREETGLLIDDWTPFCSLSVGESRIHCYYSVTDKIFNYKQIEEEELSIYDIYPVQDNWSGQAGPVSDKHFGHYYRVFNIDWLILMALNNYLKLDKANSFNIKEN